MPHRDLNSSCNSDQAAIVFGASARRINETREQMAEYERDEQLEAQQLAQRVAHFAQQATESGFENCDVRAQDPLLCVPSTGMLQSGLFLAESTYKPLKPIYLTSPAAQVWLALETEAQKQKNIGFKDIINVIHLQKKDASNININTPNQALNPGALADGDQALALVVANTNTGQALNPGALADGGQALDLVVANTGQALDSNQIVAKSEAWLLTKIKQTWLDFKAASWTEIQETWLRPLIIEKALNLHWVANTLYTAVVGVLSITWNFIILSLDTLGAFLFGSTQPGAQLGTQLQNTVNATQKAFTVFKETLDGTLVRKGLNYLWQLMVDNVLLDINHPLVLIGTVGIQGFFFFSNWILDSFMCRPNDLACLALKLAHTNFLGVLFVLSTIAVKRRLQYLWTRPTQQQATGA